MKVHRSNIKGPEIPGNPEIIEKQSKALRHLGTVLDLDQEGIQIIQSIPSGFGGQVGGAVHGLELIELKGNQYWLKEEEVYCDSRQAFSYQSFTRFVESLFVVGDGMINSRSFSFENDPEHPTFTISYSLVNQHRQTIESLTLDSSPESIEEEDLKELFLLYLAKRAELIEEGGTLKDKVYGHQGREVINEALASALGKLLEIPTAETYLAKRKKNFYYPYRKEQVCKLGVLRLTASKNLLQHLDEKLRSHDFNNLAEFCLTISTQKQYQQLAGAFDYNWHYANPLGIEALTSQEPLIQKKSMLALQLLQHPEDLAASDFLDHLLGGSKDRKLQEYILPEGSGGRIYTIDFGEILFPEIQFAADSASYQRAKTEYLEHFQQYLNALQVEELPAIYLNEANRILGVLKAVSKDFFKQLCAEIPAFFYRSHWDDEQPCYNPESLTDLFQGLQQLIVNSKPSKVQMDLNSEYQIPKGKKLLILDAHDTVFKRDYSREVSALFEQPEDKERITWVLREGLLNFITYFHDLKRIKIVISSDGGKMQLTEVSKKFGIFKSLEKIYDASHIHFETKHKQLDLILKEMEVTKEEALFIGDGRIDELSCLNYGVDFIKVPNTVEGRDFSFNSFIHLDFNQDNYGLELQKITNLKKIYHNLSTPELVERAVVDGEGKLGHLGPLVVNYDADQENKVTKFIVKEPSSEDEIDWSGEYHPFDMEQFEPLYLRMLAFLQDREIYILDCYSGASQNHRIPLRVLTQTAWHGLFIRNMFLQIQEEEMKGFFPEFTLIFVPAFQAVPEYDQIESKAFVMINLVRKTVIIAGTMNPEHLREAVFAVLSVILPMDDVIPIRCSANRGKEGDLSLFFGATPTFISLDQSRDFFGDDCHGWARDSFFNMEWGCLMPIKGLDSKKHPLLYQAIRSFGTLLLQTKLKENRRLALDSMGTLETAKASFPLAHFPHADRSGVADLPKKIFLFIQDTKGIFPPLAKLTYHEAVLQLLLGYGSGQDKFASPLNSLLGSRPFTFSPPRYASLLLERLHSSQVECYILNTSANPRSPDIIKENYQKILEDLVQEIHQGRISEGCFTAMPLLGLSGLTHWENKQGYQMKDLWPDSNAKNEERIQAAKIVYQKLESQKSGMVIGLKKRIQEWVKAIDTYLEEKE